MSNRDSPGPITAKESTSADAQTELEAKRRRLIDNIAYLVVREFRRRQIEADDPERSAAEQPPA